MVTAVQLKKPVEPLTPIEPDMLEVVEVPERWVPDAAIVSVDETAGLVSATGYEAGTLVQTGMLVPRPGIQPGFREVAIIVDAETGVAGKVTPGDHVDIIATVEETEERPPSSEVWVENALVLDVGLPSEIEDEGDDFGTSQGVPVTFALTTEDSLRLAYAESFSVKLRLALRGAGDEQKLPEDDRTYSAQGE